MAKVNKSVYISRHLYFIFVDNYNCNLCWSMLKVNIYCFGFTCIRFIIYKKSFSWHLLLVNDSAVDSSIHYCYLICEIVNSNDCYSTLALYWSSTNFY